MTLCHKLKISNLYIFATWWGNPFIFQTCCSKRGWVSKIYGYKIRVSSKNLIYLKIVRKLMGNLTHLSNTNCIRVCKSVFFMNCEILTLTNLADFPKTIYKSKCLDFFSVIPSLGSYELPYQFWAFLALPMWRLLMTNQQTNVYRWYTQVYRIKFCLNRTRVFSNT